MYYLDSLASKASMRFNTRPAPAPGPSVPDKSIPDLKKGLGKWSVSITGPAAPARVSAGPQEEAVKCSPGHRTVSPGHHPVLLVPKHLTPGTWTGTEGTSPEQPGLKEKLEGGRGACTPNPGTAQSPGEALGRVCHLLLVTGAPGGWYRVLLAGSESSIIYGALGDAQKQGATQA